MDRLIKAAIEALRTLEVGVGPDVDYPMWQEVAWERIVELRKAIKHSQKIVDSVGVNDKNLYSPDYAAHLIQKTLKENSFLPGDRVSIHFTVEITK